jgi:hypothetical protein
MIKKRSKEKDEHSKGIKTRKRGRDNKRERQHEDHIM